MARSVTHQSRAESVEWQRPASRTGRAFRDGLRVRQDAAEGRAFIRQGSRSLVCVLTGGAGHKAGRKRGRGCDRYQLRFERSGDERVLVFHGEAWRLPGRQVERPRERCLHLLTTLLKHGLGTRPVVVFVMSIRVGVRSRGKLPWGGEAAFWAHGERPRSGRRDTCNARGRPDAQRFASIREVSSVGAARNDWRFFDAGRGLRGVCP
jgi:hypothetical protein